jgi:hypothetical protein
MGKRDDAQIKYVRIPVPLLERLEALRLGHEGQSDVICRALAAGVERLENA